MTQQDYESQQDAFLKVVNEVLLEAYKATGYEWIVCPGTGGLRSIATQNKLYAKGRTEPGEIVTQAQGGQSPHNFDLARDIYPCIKSGQPWFSAPIEVFSHMGEIAEKHGLTWGGRFQSIKDWPHIEDRNWKKVQAAWRNKELEFS